MTGPDPNTDQLDRLLHEVVRDRAGDPPPPPPDEVLDGLRTRAAARRRRRSRLVAVAATAVIVIGGALVGLARLPDSDTHADRLEVVDEPTTAPSTTTTSPPSTTVPPSTAPDTSTTVVPGDSGDSGDSGESDDSDGSVAGPAIGAPAEVYVGVSFVTHTDDGQLWTADGRSLDYLMISGDLGLGGAGRVVTVFDGDHAMLWLLEPGGTAEAGTVVDAVDLPASAADVEAGLGGGCTAATTTTDAAVVALVRRPAEGGAMTVLQAWTVEPAASRAALEPLASVDGVECTGLAGEQ